jgi:hypothetical protein
VCSVVSSCRSCSRSIDPSPACDSRNSPAERSSSVPAGNASLTSSPNPLPPSGSQPSAGCITSPGRSGVACPPLMNSRSAAWPSKFCRVVVSAAVKARCGSAGGSAGFSASSSRGLLEALPPLHSGAPTSPPSMAASTGTAEQGLCGSRWQPRSSAAARERRQQPVCGAAPPSSAALAAGGHLCGGRRLNVPTAVRRNSYLHAS